MACKGEWMSEDHEGTPLPLQTKLLHIGSLFGGTKFLFFFPFSTAPYSWRYCNVMIGAVLPWKPQTCRLQLQFFVWCCVEIHYFYVVRFHYRIFFLFQHTICSNFVSLGSTS